MSLDTAANDLSVLVERSRLISRDCLAAGAAVRDDGG